MPSPIVFGGRSPGCLDDGRCRETMYAAFVEFTGRACFFVFLSVASISQSWTSTIVQQRAYSRTHCGPHTPPVRPTHLTAHHKLCGTQQTVTQSSVFKTSPQQAPISRRQIFSSPFLLLSTLPARCLSQTRSLHSHTFLSLPVSVSLCRGRTT